MRGYLLDTNVVSEYSRTSPPDPRVRTWVDAQDEDALYLSALSLGEIRKGITLLPPGKRQLQLERWLQVDVPARFANRVSPINSEIAEIWGAMAGQAQLKGVAMGIVDGLIAATAKHHGLTLVTRNVKNFTVWNIPIANPWEPI